MGPIPALIRKVNSNFFFKVQNRIRLCWDSELKIWIGGSALPRYSSFEFEISQHPIEKKNRKTKKPRGIYLISRAVGVYTVNFCCSRPKNGVPASFPASEHHFKMDFTILKTRENWKGSPVRCQATRRPAQSALPTAPIVKIILRDVPRHIRYRRTQLQYWSLR